MDHIFPILTRGDPVWTAIQRVLSILKLSPSEPAFPSVASNVTPPAGPLTIIFACFIWVFL